jgi:hypothetical protein
MASSSFIATARGIVQRQSTLVKSARASSALTTATSGMRTSSSDGLLAAGAGATITAALVTQLYSSHFNTATLASAHSSLRQDYNLSAKVWGFSQ